MKNLKAQFKLIIYLFLLLNIHNTLLTRNLDKFSDSGDIANYFSGILSKNNYQYKKSYYYLKSLNNLEDFHYTYSQHYQHSLVALGKFKEAAGYTKKLNDKKLDNFESNLISIIYHLENEDFKNASSYLQKLKNNSQPDTVQDLVSRSLNIWLNFKNIEDLGSALKLLDTVPKRFNNIKNIQKTFVYCYFDSPKADIMFKQLILSSNVDYTRYNFFYSNYLISKNNEKKAQEVLGSSLKQNPNNLILNQLKIDLIKKKTFNNKFECKNTTDVMAEIFYVIANALSSQNNYIASNFYLNLARYLNPNFVSYDSLYAENFFLINEYEKAKKIYNQIKQKGSTYNWYASKQIASILSEQNQKKDSIKSLKNSFIRLENPTIYEIFDYAEFLKNNDKYKESIKYYSDVLNSIDSKNALYGKAVDGRGIAYERTDQWNKAEIDLLNSLNASPNDAYAINYLAYSWIEKGVNIKKSLSMLEKANKLRPNDGYIIDSLGWALFKLKKYKEAKKQLELAVIFMASDPVVNDHYADALWMNNKSLQARYYWNYVLKLEKTEEKLKNEVKQKLLFGLKR
jgi:tetratricopeptide (TPR) repeat protein